MSKITLDNYEAFLLDYMEGNLDPAMVEELMIFAASHPELDIDLSDAELPVITAEALEYDFKTTLKKTNEPLSSEILFDYLEGNLPSAEQEKVAAELLNNKALALEFELLKKTLLRPNEAIRFESKATLYKTEEDLMFRDRVLVYFEGQMSDREKQQFEVELKNNSLLQKELGQYSKTRLSADLLVGYPDKEELKKEARVIGLSSVRRLSAMAAALLLLAGLFVIFRQVGPSTQNTQPGLANAVKPSKKQNSDPNSNEVRKNTPSPVAPASGTTTLKPSFQLPTSPGVPVPVIPQTPSQQEEGPALAQDKTQTPSSVQDKVQNSPSVKKEEKAEESFLAQQPKTETPLIPIQPSHHDTASSGEHLTKYTLLAVTEDPEENEERGRKGFLSKAARFGKRANDIGIKVVDGNESRRRISLFNAFSVEKH